MDPEPVDESALSGARALRAAFDAVSVEAMRGSRRIKWRRYGDQVIPAWVADMDLPIAPEIHAVLAEAVARHDFGYHELPLDPRLRAAFVERMARRYGWAIDPGSVWALVNVVQALDATVLLFSEPGEGVLLQTPIYAPFHQAVDGSGRRRVESPLVRGERRYEIDLDHLRAVIDSQTKVFLLCNPHNPCGRAFTRAELEKLAEIVIEHDLVVLADEIHADLVLAHPADGDAAQEGPAHIPFASLGPEVARRTVTATSATKAFNLAGLPMAVAHFGSDELKQRFRSLPPHLLAHGGLLGTEAAIAAWTRADGWLDAVRVYLRENRDFAAEFLESRLPEVVHRPPEATYLAWLDCRALGLLPDPWTFFLRRAGVALSDGEEFGAPGGGHVRLNLATSRRILAEILERMAAAVERWREEGPEGDRA